MLCGHHGIFLLVVYNIFDESKLMILCYSVCKYLTDLPESYENLVGLSELDLIDLKMSLKVRACIFSSATRILVEHCDYTLASSSSAFDVIFAFSLSIF